MEKTRARDNNQNKNSNTFQRYADGRLRSNRDDFSILSAKICFHICFRICTIAVIATSNLSLTGW